MEMPPGGLACGSFGLSRGSVIDPFEPQHGSTLCNPADGVAVCVRGVRYTSVVTKLSLHGYFVVREGPLRQLSLSWPQCEPVVYAFCFLHSVSTGFGPTPCPSMPFTRMTCCTTHIQLQGSRSNTPPPPPPSGVAKSQQRSGVDSAVVCLSVVLSSPHACVLA